MPLYCFHLHHIEELKKCENRHNKVLKFHLSGAGECISIGVRRATIFSRTIAFSHIWYTLPMKERRSHRTATRHNRRETTRKRALAKLLNILDYLIALLLLLWRYQHKPIAVGTRSSAIAERNRDAFESLSLSFFSICESVVYLRPLLKSNCLSGSLSRKLLWTDAYVFY